jgi:hypothetical protein
MQHRLLHRSLSDIEPASRYLFYSFKAGWYGDLPPSPSRQFLALLPGMVEVETSEGTVKQPGAGDLILLEDTSGKGHRSRNTGTGYLNLFFVQVPVASGRYQFPFMNQPTSWLFRSRIRKTLNRPELRFYSPFICRISFMNERNSGVEPVSRCRRPGFPALGNGNGNTCVT